MNWRYLTVCYACKWIIEMTHLPAMDEVCWCTSPLWFWEVQLRPTPYRTRRPTYRHSKTFHG